MNYILSFILATLLALAGMAQTNISGVINNYYSVSAINVPSTRLTLNTTSGITEGDTLLLIQMKGATIDLSVSDDYGDVTDYGGAGNFEEVEICEVIGNDVVLKKKLKYDFSAGGSVQLVSIPYYTNANINGTLTAQTWDGSAGGVLIFKVDGTLSFNADIDLNGRGFRGGEFILATNMCNFLTDYDQYEYETSTMLGGMKGEGIAPYTTHNLGKGALANGGGGGNDHNSGGAGGANVTPGGNGGDNDDPGQYLCKGYHPGRGGKALDYTAQRIFMGGGGGAGHSNNGTPALYFAGDGGGIVMIQAGTVEGNNHQILNNGTDGCNGIGDGASGGGAGGTIFLEVQNYSSPLTAYATGGDGGDGDGDSQILANGNRCFGPGGGGSGGLIWLSQSAFPGNFTTDVTGGQNGIVSNTDYAPCAGLAQGATPGADGIVAYDAALDGSRIANKACYSNPQEDLGADTIICEGETLTLTATMTGTYEWSTGATSQQITVSTTGDYWVGTDDGMCIFYDTIHVEVVPVITVNLGPDRTLCDGGTLDLDAGAGSNQYNWSTGETTQEITISQTGTYWVVAGSGQCTTTDTVNVTVDAYISPFSGPVEICSYEGVELDAGPANSYGWSTGENTQIITVYEPDTYQITIENTQGCFHDDEVEVIGCANNEQVPNTITPNGDGANDVWNIGNIYSYPGNKVTILDRSGRTVYEATNYNNDWNGDGLPATTYYYVIDFNNGGTLQKGTITIVRQQ